LAFAVLDSPGYEKAATIINEARERKEKQLEEAVKDLKRSLAEGGIKKFRTETRVKSIYSFFKKLEEKDGNIDRVYDLFAVRIIVPTIEDCYRTLGIVHKKWRPVIGRVKDYIATAKPNGYQSIHSSVITGSGISLEVQIRTEEMHHEAQYGIASHFGYKTKDASAARSYLNWITSFLPVIMKTPKPAKKHETPRWLRDLTDIDAEHLEREALHEALKEDFFAERMFIYTPKGDVIDLPVGATPVDFAYEVHTDLVENMAGAKINGKMVQINSPLHNGDVVEILRKKNSKPNKKWVEYAKTARAKRHIRNILKKAEEGS
jgi:GTP diphosphokinase / guanosine-3',5'-bis(diphosphate) 3'-diphosphatase